MTCYICKRHIQNDEPAVKVKISTWKNGSYSDSDVRVHLKHRGIKDFFAKKMEVSNAQ